MSSWEYKWWDSDWICGYTDYKVTNTETGQTGHVVVDSSADPDVAVGEEIADGEFYEGLTDPEDSED